jgi:hypothetical protein
VSKSEREVRFHDRKVKRLDAEAGGFVKLCDITRAAAWQASTRIHGVLDETKERGMIRSEGVLPFHEGATIFTHSEARQSKSVAEHAVRTRFIDLARKEVAWVW